MHQHPRPPPTTASPANSEQTNPIRSNNQRDRDSRTNSALTQESASSEDFTSTRQDQPTVDSAGSMQRLNQVISNFHTKAALIILHSRSDLSPAYSSKTNEKRVNKWFNIELDETDDYIDDIRRWKKCDVFLDRPPPLIIEIYLTTDPLPQGQQLVILDDEQKRWDVNSALEPRQSARNGKRRPADGREILLERWTVALGEPRQPVPADLTSILPHVYKKSILLFRALYTYCNFLPAWKLIRKLGKSRFTMGMKVGFRIVDGDQLDSIPRADNLTTPLYDSGADVVTDYSFGSTDSPAGPFSVQVKYRSNCDFRIDDSEELLSSRFIGADDDIFRPSPARDQNDNKNQTAQKVGSLPNDQRRNLLQRPELGHAYGSLSTFHQAGISPGTSPISALRAAKELGSDSPSPQRPVPQQAQTQSQRPAVPNRTSTTGRQNSFSIQPFKAPTLAASPLGASPLGASPRISTKAIPTLGSLQEEVTIPPPNVQAIAARKPASITSDNVGVSSTSSSPRPAPAQRFTSSFGHRKNRPSLDRTANKTDDDQTSSGKASAASSGQPGSGLMIEAAGGNGSSGSIHEDDEKISDFLKMLDLKKDLLNTASSSALDASARRTAAALTRFHKMRDSNAALSESMASSLMVPKPAPSPSRVQAGTPAISTSSSPGKPVSPHTPHTPFAPSRLSAAYSHDDPESQEEMKAVDDNLSPDEQPQEPSVALTANPGAIDIPSSPRIFVPGYRRSSSAQRIPLPSEEDIGDLYGMRSASMGAQGRPRRQDSSADPPVPDTLKPLDDVSPVEEHREDVRPQTSAGPTGPDETISDSGSGRSSLPNAYRSRFVRGGTAGRGSHASLGQGSTSSIGGTGGSAEKVGDSGSASSSWVRGGRPQGLTRPENRTGDDDDFLPFVMDASTFTPNKGESKPRNVSER
ncbi:autophagy protein 13 [Neophaeococcomyces mojaviensis]|uniref:Autophagy protein 13 n=1 Tax=Neophaeococcomyces mojaviensis TaxID=3383035 RepID=A0ACC3A693_9EURO|nr:autophagy protein 13 [Knufia sp. JES_112]